MEEGVAWERRYPDRLVQPQFKTSASVPECAGVFSVSVGECGCELTCL
jgi:hypothetical protein